ncbi:MAG: hybrid sensor histidine kinase/response regulator, partial [Cyanobacteria bacterium J06623_1]
PFSEQTIFDKLTQHLGVAFIYEAEVEHLANEPVKASKPLTLKDLESLSPGLVKELNQAAIAVDGEKIEQLITQISDSQQHIAQKISDMLAEYDFDAIIDLTNGQSTKAHS